MQYRSQDTYAPPPQVFHYSLDWRFLLPLADARNIYVLTEEDADFRETLQQVRISFSSLLVPSNNQGNNIQSLVLPFGLPVRWVSKSRVDQAEFFRSIRPLIGADGYLLIGFENAWNLR